MSRGIPARPPARGGDSQAARGIRGRRDTGGGLRWGDIPRGQEGQTIDLLELRQGAAKINTHGMSKE